MRTIGAPSKADLLFAAITESPAALLLIDPNRPERPVVCASSAFAALTGYAEAELEGHAVPPLAGPDAAAAARLGEALRGRAAAGIEFECYRKDGSRFPARLAVGPVRGANGGVRYLFCTLVDFGGRSELVRGFGHDLNNLLTVMRSNLEPLRRAPADARAPQRLERIAWAVDRAADVVRDLASRFRPAEAPASGSSGKLPRAGEGEVVLLIEADEVLGLQAGSMLRGLGYRTACVAEAEAALAVLSGQERVDLLIADARARCASGTLLAERARAVRSGLKILPCTSARARRRGEIGKPFQLLELARAVRAAIDESRAG